MRINEIITESEVLDEITRPGQGKAEYMLEKAGYEKLGYGVSGVVYAKPGEDHVLKLFRSWDKSYKLFVNFTLQHPNIHYPKFKGKMMKITDEYYAIRMEKLTPITHDYDRLMVRTMKDYITQRIADNFREIDLDNAPWWVRDMEKLETKQPGITEVCEELAKFINETQAGLDLQPANVMLRGNTLVITDPVV